MDKPYKVRVEMSFMLEIGVDAICEDNAAAIGEDVALGMAQDTANAIDKQLNYDTPFPVYCLNYAVRATEVEEEVEDKKIDEPQTIKYRYGTIPMPLKLTPRAQAVYSTTDPLIIYGIWDGHGIKAYTYKLGSDPESEPMTADELNAALEAIEVKYKIVMTCGTVRHDWMHGLTYAEALSICHAHDWEGNWNDGAVWDLEIEEDD